MTTFIGAFDSYQAHWNAVTLSLQRSEVTAPWRDYYDQLEAYYLSNGLYEVLDSIVQRKTRLQPDGTTRSEDLRPIYNPATRVVEFYADMLWPGTLPKALQISAENEAIIDPIQQVWKWSNWSIEKDTCARWYAMFGSMFLKVQTNQDNSRVYLQNIKPRYVTDMDLDERGFITWLRIDLPQTTRNAEGKLESIQRTEVWEPDRYRVWLHKRTPETPLTELGSTIADQPTSAFGIDFVPIVYQPFRSNGDERGIGAFTLYIDKLDEVARMATRLHQTLYRYGRPIMATIRPHLGGDNRPLPAVQIGEQQADGSRKLNLDDDDILNLPGASDIRSLVPDIDYAQSLAILQDQLAQLGRDMPELAYSRIAESTELSGVAIAYLLDGAISKLESARGNAEAALVRAHQMALTIGQNVGLFDRSIGTFDNGDFEHEFAPRSVLSAPEMEQAQTIQAYTSAGVPMQVAAKRIGWSEQEIEETVKVKDEHERKMQEQQQQLLNQQPGIASRLAAGRNGQAVTNGRPQPAN